MLRYFPALRPDELLYSACARFRSRLQFCSHKEVLTALYDKSSVLAVVDLPCNLAAFEVESGGRSDLRAEYLIQNHTLFPLYSAFMPLGRAAQIRRDMKADGGRRVHLRVGLMAGAAAIPAFLRFCPQCDAENMRRFGHTFWERSHQIPGITVCAKHALFLLDSTVRRRNRQTRHSFADSNHVVKPTVTRSVDPANPGHRCLLRIARSAEWVLSHDVENFPHLSPHPGYLQLLCQRGLASCNGRVVLDRLSREFAVRYSPELLRGLHCDLKGNWLRELLRRPLTVHSPVHHLIMIDFLELDAERFFNAPVVALFEAGPYPCLNPVCSDRNRPLIGSPLIEHHPDRHCPVGIFTCARCDYAYARFAPDGDGTKRFDASFVSNYGRVWSAILSAEWKNPSASLRSIARRLAVDPTTVKRQAHKLNLRFPRQGPRPTRRGKAIYIPRQRGSGRLSKQQRRGHWRSVRREHPTFGIKLLRLSQPAEYSWLYRNDREWLRQNFPARRSRSVRMSTLWSPRDVDICRRLRGAASELRAREDKPVRVSTAALERLMEVTPYLTKHLSKLPLTKSVLENLVETREDFAIRRIRIAARKSAVGDLPMNRSRLIRAAGLRADLLTVPMILVALGNCIANVLPDSHSRCRSIARPINFRP